MSPSTGVGRRGDVVFSSVFLELQRMGKVQEPIISSVTQYRHNALKSTELSCLHNVYELHGSLAAWDHCIFTEYSFTHMGIHDVNKQASQ
jgi:hypothetical protein